MLAGSGPTWSVCRPFSRSSRRATMGLESLAISMVSNYAAGISDTPLDHEEVLETGRAAASSLQHLLEALLLSRMRP